MKMKAAQESAKRAEAREVGARRRAESESAAQATMAISQNFQYMLEAEFGPSSTNSQP